MKQNNEIQAVTALGKRFSDVTIMMHEAIARKAGLSGTDHKYLNILVEHGAMTAGDLAKISGLTTGAVTGVIDRLEKQKLVKREFGKDDRRKVIIVPELKIISKVLAPSFLVLQEKIVALVETFSEKEKKIISNYMTDAIKIMEDVTNGISSQAGSHRVKK